MSAQRAAIVSTLSTTTASAKPLTAAQTELSQLVLSSSVAAQNFSTLSGQYQQALLGSGQNTVETMHIDKAAPPVLPTSPIRYLYLLVGLVLGALLSFLIVHARVLRRARAAGVIDEAAEAADTDAPHVGLVNLVEAETPGASIPVQVPSVNGHAAVSGRETPPTDSAGG